MVRGNGGGDTGAAGIAGVVTPSLVGFIEHRYSATGVSLDVLADGGKSVYRVRRADGPDWVLRAYPPAGAAQAGALAAMLLFLEGRDYLAERVVRGSDGGAVVSHEGQHLLVTTFLGKSLQAWAPAAAFSIPSPTLSYTPQVLEALGAALGRLHALRLTGGEGLPAAGMLPRPELAWATECLASVDGCVPSELMAEYQRLVLAVRDADLLEDLPPCLIHDDCNLGNAVVTPTGEIVLVDWEGAGLGPAVVDLGFLLSSCYSKQERRVNTQAVHAIIDGYRLHHDLSAAEIERLRGAVSFRALVLLACCFPRRVDGTLTDDEQLYGASYAEWRAQHEASGEIAALALERFGYKMIR